MKKLFPVLLMVVIGMCLASCKKDAAKRAASEVMIRIHNESGQMLNSAEIATVAYGNVNTGNTTDYKAMNMPIVAIMCSFKQNDEVVMSGYGVCGTPPPPYIEGGYYTIKIMSGQDDTFPVEVTKD